MNMMTDTTRTDTAVTALTSGTPLARPLGMPLDVKKRRSRDEVLVALIPILVGRGLPTDVARTLTAAVYDGYVKAFGGAPANADDVAKALATPKGKAALAELAAPHLAAYNAAKAEKLAAEQAKKAPEPSAPVVVVKAMAEEPRVSTSTQKVLEGWLEKALRLYLALDPDRRAALGDKALHTVLVKIAQRCWDEGVKIFHPPYMWGSQEGYAIGNLLQKKPIAGIGFEYERSEPMPQPKATKAPQAPKVLPPDVEDALTARLRDAMQRYLASGTNRETRHDRILDAALREIVAECRRHDIDNFQTPYVNGKIAPFPEGAYAMSRLIGRLLALKDELGSFGINGTPLAQGGLLDEKVVSAQHHAVPVGSTKGLTRAPKRKGPPADRLAKLAKRKAEQAETLKTQGKTKKQK